MSDPLEEECLRRMEESRSDEPRYPGSIEGDPTELDRLREENARLKAAVEKARPALRGSRAYLGWSPVSLLEQIDEWLAANPEEAK